MQCRNILYCVFLFIAAPGLSQKDPAADATTITKITVIVPGVSYEKRVGRQQTLQVQAFASIDFGIGYSSSFGTTSFLHTSPAVGLQYRYYYNAERRSRIGKRTAMNSMNYVAPLYTMVFSSWSISDAYLGEEKRRPIHSVRFAWGFQRNYENRFSIDINAGPGINFAKTTLYDQNDQPIGRKTASAFAIGIQVRIGCWLNRRNNSSLR
ncbi:MAG: hypothetical protein ABI813_09190 [Bacteroidota bacterium]